MSRPKAVFKRLGSLVALAASLVLALPVGCARGGVPAPTPGPAMVSSPTPESAQTPAATYESATPIPSLTGRSTAAPSTTPTARPSPSATFPPTAAASVSATPSALTPTLVVLAPTAVASGTYAITGMVLFDEAHGRRYAQGRVGEEGKTLVLGATEDDLLAAYDYTGTLGLDAEHRRLYVDAAGTELVILNADTGERLGEVVLPSQEGYQPTAVAPQVDPALGQVFAFRQNLVYVADATSGRVLHTIPFDFEKSQDCRTGEGPYPIEWAAYDPSNRILYLSYLAYVCTPWFGFTIISYDLAAGQEIARSGEYRFQATVSGGYLYGSSWHRFGIGYIWAWRDGKPWRRASDWNSQPVFVVDKVRQRLYGLVGGSLGVFDAQSMDLLFVTPWPSQGPLQSLSASQINEPEAENLTATAAPTVSVDALVVSPAWPADRTLVGIWGKAQPTDQCYAFAQQGGKLLFSSDGGQVWAQPGAGLPECRYVSCLAVSPDFARDQTLLVGLVGLGVFRSTDGGRLWKPASAGLGSMSVQELILSPGFAVDQTVFVRVGTGGPYRSIDGGRTWQELGFATYPRVEQLLLSPGFARDRTLFAQLSSEELYRSRDAGLTWQNLGVARRPLALSPEFDRDGIILGAAPDSTDLHISRDGGTSWERLGNTPAAMPIHWISLAPLFAKWGVAFARGRDPIPTPEGPGTIALYRTSDGGVGWQQVFLQSGQPLDIAAGATVTFLYAPGIEENRPIYLLTVEEDYATTPPTRRGLLYRSGDGGMTWKQAALPSGVVPTAVTVSPQFAADRLVFIGTADGRVLAVPDDTL